MERESDSEYLTVEEACALLEVKRATLYAYVSRGLVHSYKQGIRRQRLYRRAEIEALLAVRPSEEPPLSEVAGESEAMLPSAEEWISEH